MPIKSLKELPKIIFFSFLTGFKNLKLLKHIFVKKLIYKNLLKIKTEKGKIKI